MGQQARSCAPPHASAYCLEGWPCDCGGQTHLCCMGFGVLAAFWGQGLSTLAVHWGFHGWGGRWEAPVSAVELEDEIGWGSEHAGDAAWHHPCPSTSLLSHHLQGQHRQQAEVQGKACDLACVATQSPALFQLQQPQASRDRWWDGTGVSGRLDHMPPPAASATAAPAACRAGLVVAHFCGA